MSQSKYKKWLINVFILVLVTVLMLALAEVAMRWFDGFQLSTFQLQQDTNNAQQVE